MWGNLNMEIFSMFREKMKDLSYLISLSDG